MSGPVVRVCEVGGLAVDPAMLTSPERDRWERLVHADDRAAYLAAHVLVRTVVAELLGLAPAQVELTHRCPVCDSAEHGRPAIVDHPEVYVSLSHTRVAVAAIAALTGCGIDVESTRSTVPDEVLTHTELAWAGEDPARRTRLWVRREAWAKAEGRPLDRVLAGDLVDLHHDGAVTGELLTDAYAAAWVVL